MPYVKELDSGNWRAQYRDARGKRHSKTLPGKKQARDWALEQERLVRLGRHRDPKAVGQTVGDYFPTWWDARSVEVTTEATDRGRIDKHVLPKWSDWPLEAIVPTAVQGWVKKLVADGMAPATARSCHQLLSSLLGAAMVDGLIDSNPAKGIRRPVSEPGKEVFLSRAEVDAIAAAMESDFDRAVLYTLAYTGLRWGELAGLRIKRLSPAPLPILRAPKSLTVCAVLIEVGGKRTFKEYPKSRKGRPVPIPATVPTPVPLSDLLFEHLAARPGGGDDVLFRPEPSGLLSRFTWGRWRFKPAVLAANRAAARAAEVESRRSGQRVRPHVIDPKVRVHDLRHTYASWLVQAGVPLADIQRVLGHASVTTTERYAHLGPDRHGTVLKAFDAAALRELGHG